MKREKQDGASRSDCVTTEEKFNRLYQENCEALITRDSCACNHCLIRKKSKGEAACEEFMDDWHCEAEQDEMMLFDKPVVEDCINYMYDARYNRKKFDNDTLIEKLKCCAFCTYRRSCYEIGTPLSELLEVSCVDFEYAIESWRNR